MGQVNAIYNFSIKLSFSSRPKGQNKSKLQKQISNVCFDNLLHVIQFLLEIN